MSSKIISTREHNKLVRMLKEGEYKGNAVGVISKNTAYLVHRGEDNNYVVNTILFEAKTNTLVITDKGVVFGPDRTHKMAAYDYVRDIIGYDNLDVYQAYLA